MTPTMAEARNVAREQIAWQLNRPRSLAELCIGAGYPQWRFLPFDQVIECFALIWLADLQPENTKRAA